jgi:succinylarginine dihydrolase
MSNAVPGISIQSVVATYLLNSQLVTLPSGGTALIAPVECRQDIPVQNLIETMRQSQKITSVHYVDVRQSMQNGGGPACLRLRVVVTDDEIATSNPGVFWSDALHQTLTDWVNRHYREELKSDDLADPKLLVESRDALDQLSKILGLGDVYEFQGAR